MEDPELPSGPDTQEPANLKFLRLLVTDLTDTMIGGVIHNIGLIVIRFYDVPPPLPDTLALPQGAQAMSFTQGPDWYAVVTTDNQILIFDRVTGNLKQSVQISP